MAQCSGLPEMAKAYEAAEVEKKWYQYWMEKGYFKPNPDSDKKPFVIIMPPPNVTGELHLGHALTATLEDIMIRWHRMLGEPALWLPGADHAGIAAQVVVERMLAKQGKTRQELGRELFLEKMWEWVNPCRERIRHQHMRLGASCDWDRETFTLDPGPVKAVREIFTNLYQKGLIYRGERIINWCPRCATAVSDLEVDHKDLAGHIWHLRYPLEDGSGFVTVATTRPETMLGDTAVAVHPDDARYTGIVGKNVLLPIMNRRIPIIADEAVDMAFGTGAVKVTPAHDPNDFEMGLRHSLPMITIQNRDTTMNENAGPCSGMTAKACREYVVSEIESLGLLLKIEDYTHSVGHCQRCSAVIEPMVSKQWFVKMEPLAKPALEAVNSGRIQILPERFTKVYQNWMENIRDWCISRQLWWGHRIPVWYCPCGEMIVSKEDPAACPKCGSTKLEQDPDVLDTWFSSGLWPHSTLGWPDQTEDLKRFYPGSVLETAYDIIFFWVARMIVMGIEDMKEVPFRTVYLHGLIRDDKGEKMSKTKGNVIDPLKVIDQYGTDALRFAVTFGTSPGNDSKLGQTKLEAARNFVNKLWNASRFVIMNLGEEKELLPEAGLPLEDRWILSRMNRVTADVIRLMEEFQFGEAQRVLQDFVWGEFCDWYIELAKVRLRDEASVSPRPVLVKVLSTILRLLHPYMPFITEELWSYLRPYLPKSLGETDIIVAPFPQADETCFDEQAESIMGSLVEVVRSLRNLRAEHNVEISRYIQANIYAGDMAEVLSNYLGAVETLSRSRPVNILPGHYSGASTATEVVLVLNGIEVVVPMSTMVDLEAEAKRVEAEIAELETQIERLSARLSDTQFLAKAPQAVVDKERTKLEGYIEKVSRLKAV